MFSIKEIEKIVTPENVMFIHNDGFESKAKIEKITGFNCYWLSMITVHNMHRGYGIGNKLLKKILEFIKEQNAIIFAEPVSSGTMTNDELTNWYIRNGFKILTEEKRKEVYEATGVEEMSGTSLIVF